MKLLSSFSTTVCMSLYIALMLMYAKFLLDLFTMCIYIYTHNESIFHRVLFSKHVLLSRNRLALELALVYVYIQQNSSHQCGLRWAIRTTLSIQWFRTRAEYSNPGLAAGQRGILTLSKCQTSKIKCRATVAAVQPHYDCASRSPHSISHALFLSQSTSFHFLHCIIQLLHTSRVPNKPQEREREKSAFIEFPGRRRRLESRFFPGRYSREAQRERQKSRSKFFDISLFLYCSSYIADFFPFAVYTCSITLTYTYIYIRVKISFRVADFIPGKHAYIQRKETLVKIARTFRVLLFATYIYIYIQTPLSFSTTRKRERESIVYRTS